MISIKIFSGQRRKIIKELRHLKSCLDVICQNKIQVEWLISLPRSLPDHLLASDIDIISALHEQGLIAGVAVVGVDYDKPLKRFYSHFEKLKSQSVGIEVHLGEHYAEAEMEAFIDTELVDRIGHGIFIFENVGLLEKIKQHNIHIEFSITSNLRTGCVPCIEKHPILIAREIGLSYSINTDDPGIFNCTLDEEFYLLHQKLGFTKDDFNKVFQNSLAAAFRATDNVRCQESGPRISIP